MCFFRAFEHFLKKTAIISLLAATLFLPAAAHPASGPAQVDVKEIIKKVDRLYRSSSSHGEIEMEVTTPHWKRTLSMKIWTRGMDSTFILITAPKKDEGIATLRIGTDMWNYFPRINKVLKVPPSMMMGSWMGSDFTNDDLVKESSMLKDYEYRLVAPPGAETGFYYIELTPRVETPTVWGRILVKVRRDDYIPVTQHYYDEKGQLIRVLTFSEIARFGDRKIPAVMEMKPVKKEGRRTVVRYRHLVFDEPVDDSIFTLRNLRKRR
jgi:outer membrane lipoprotein-sorting protein